MIKIDDDSLKKFDLYFPGHWIDDEDREWAFRVYNTLSLAKGLFVEAVAAYALFYPISQENVSEYTRKDVSPYEHCLNGLYAKAFVFALHSIEKLLYRLSVDKKRPNEIERLYEEYKNLFGHLKHIRDSAIHIEDRGRGVTRHQQPLKAPIIVIGSFIEKRFTFTGEDGNQYEVDISDATLNMAKEIIQKIINSYGWS